MEFYNKHQNSGIMYLVLIVDSVFKKVIVTLVCVRYCLWFVLDVYAVLYVSACVCDGLSEWSPDTFNDSQ